MSLSKESKDRRDQEVSAVDEAFHTMKAQDICTVSQRPVRIHSCNGSCDKGHCYYSMAFSCRETTQ